MQFQSTKCKKEKRLRRKAEAVPMQLLFLLHHQSCCLIVSQWHGIVGIDYPNLLDERAALVKASASQSQTKNVS